MGHEELQRIMKTAMAHFTDETTLLIQGIKSKFDEHGNLIDLETQNKLKSFIESFTGLVIKNQSC